MRLTLWAMFIQLRGNYGESMWVFYAIFYQIPVNRYVDFYRKRKGGTYTFSNQDIKIVSEEVQSICAWSIFKKGYDIPDSFLLRDENKFLYIFPKRCFGNATDIEKLQQLMSDNIKTSKYIIESLKYPQVKKVA